MRSRMSTKASSDIPPLMIAAAGVPYRVDRIDLRKFEKFDFGTPRNTWI